MKTNTTYKIFNDVELVAGSVKSIENIKDGKPEPVFTLDQRVSWGEDDLNLPEQLSGGGNGKDVLIFIADTGLPNHVDIPKPVMAKNHTDDSNVSDRNNHSTWINGKISAMDNDIGFRGFSPESDIGIIKVLDNRGSGYMMYEGMMSALNYWNSVKDKYLCAFYSMLSLIHI